MRHAKSALGQNGVPDTERPLTEKGKKRTKKVIDCLLRENIQIDYLITSPAIRAYDTATILAHALRYPKDEIKVDTQLYFSDGHGLMYQFYDLPDRFNKIMIIGHNPALSDFVNRFLSDPIDHLPTSGIVSITYFTDKWDRIPQADFLVNFTIFPGELKEERKKEIVV
jgi:phosphohistidine phosphatase